jgi:hypothetical protein
MYCTIIMSIIILLFYLFCCYYAFIVQRFSSRRLHVFVPNQLHVLHSFGIFSHARSGVDCERIISREESRFKSGSIHSVCCKTIEKTRK